MNLFALFVSISNYNLLETTQAYGQTQFLLKKIKINKKKMRRDATDNR